MRSSKAAGASHIRVRTHAVGQRVRERLSVCDFFVELSRTRPTIDARGRFVIQRLSLILERSAAGPGAFRHTPPALGSQQFQRKSRPGLGGLQP